MKPWISEDIVKTWTEAQKRLWDSLCSAVPFPPPAGVEAWRETYLKNLATWESAVKKTLAQEVAWVERWVHRVAEEKGTPEMMASWVRQMEEVLQRWIQTQTQWWDEYFAVLRQGGFACSEQAGVEPVSAIEPDLVVEPPPAADSAIAPEEAESEPVVTPEASAATAPAPAVEVPVEVAPAVALVSETAPAVEVPVEVAPAVAPAPEQPDDLKLITGIGPALEKKLQACGIASYRQLATLSDADIDRVEARIKSFGRIRRDDWIGQAKTRHFEKYQERL